MKLKATKRDEAAARQQAYDKLSTQEKYNRAVQRGHTNTREALRLRRALETR